MLTTTAPGVTGQSSNTILAMHMPALPARVVNCCGAGDCLAAGALMRLMEGGSAADALAHGMVSLLLPVSILTLTCFTQSSVGRQISRAVSWQSCGLATHGTSVAS